MAFQQTSLSFDLVETHNINTISIVDTSTYRDGDSGFVLQVVVPGYPVDKPIELNYYQNGVTTLNSNMLKLTNVTNPQYYSALPDGVYIAKISVCPHETYWYQRTWYRVANIWCKYYKAFLKLNVKNCEKCYSPQKLAKLNTAWLYINAVVANAEDDNLNSANELYQAADKILSELLVKCKC